MAPCSHLFYFKGIRNSNNVLSKEKEKNKIEKKNVIGIH